MPPLPPNKNPILLIDLFIQYAQTHLTTVSGLITTLSQYPPPSTPAPGLIPWTGYSVAPSTPGGGPEEVFEKIDWSKTDLEKDDPEVQEIINPDPEEIQDKSDEYIEEDVETDVAVFDEYYEEESLAAASQVNNLKAEKINKALRDQGLVQTFDSSDISTGYSSLDTLLEKAGKWARSLGKNPRVRYENLRRGYVSGIHGLCPQGTQSVCVALTGVSGLGTISGHADWFSFKSQTTGGGSASFARSIGGKTYYNNKVRITVPRDADDKPIWGATYLGDRSQWQVGDIVAMGYTGSKPYGHIQIWTGWAWVSDFTQRQIQRSHVDPNSIALWRLNSNGIAAVQSQRV